MENKERIDANNEIARQLKIGQKVMIIGHSREYGICKVICIHKGQAMIADKTGREFPVPCRYLRVISQ